MGTPYLLALVLALFTCNLPPESTTQTTTPIQKMQEEEHTLLTRRLFDLLGVTVTNLTVMRLKFLEVVVRVVDQSETGRLATTELGAESKDGD